MNTVLAEGKKFNLWLGGLITALPLLIITAHFHYNIPTASYDLDDHISFTQSAVIAFLISTFFFNISRNAYRKASNKGTLGSRFWGFFADGFYGICLLIYGFAWMFALGFILIRLSGIDYWSS